MHNHRMQLTQALLQRNDEQRTAFGNGLPVLSSIIVLLFAAPLFAVDSLFEVISPNVGQEFTIGSPITVQWVMHNHAMPGGGVMVQLSPDEGFTWFYLNKTPFGNYDTTIYNDSVGTFTWTTVDSVKVYGMGYVQLTSATCQVRITAPYDDGYLPATSHQFSIVPASKTVRPLANGNREKQLQLNRLNIDRSFVVDAISLNGRCRSTAIELISSRSSAASGVYFLRPRNNAQGQTASWCVEK